MRESLTAAVRRLAPGLFSEQPVSVVRIEMTREVFLLFGSDATQPACVAQIGASERLETLHAVLTILHDRVGRLVPWSIACVPWHEGQSLHVQAGLPGVPWFRLGDRVRTILDWAHLETRAGDALKQLHQAVAASPEWRCRVKPDAELRHQLELLSAGDRAVPPAVVAAVRNCADRLQALGEIDWFWQHGDFCVNNLLVAPAGLGIIDFEEFGATAAPLHDEIGLGLSIHACSSTGEDWDGARQHVRACVAPTLRAHPQLTVHLPGLFVHHVVWRMNQCRDRPRRSAIRARLARMLAAFAESPNPFPA